MISLLRLSVFSPSPNLTSLFLRKSSQIISTRLTLSSKILLHPTPKGLAGSIEISSHEFSGTSLSGLYLSEFCVKSTERLKGYGSTLLTGVDSYASHINVKSIYLHVEKNNLKAIKCYTRAGYDILLPKDSREVFSSKLGLGEGKHWLMGKGVEEGEILGFDI
ncbi:hypothetical protein TrVE_jg1789 [Triparma verrucosa]|uniref:N-acetyltransferase domain-containing protein n=2 Tax=Triparma TaxID=722752 RepID=A0A9W6ZSX9_9STRA|nr:hypothetical protein TrST_g10897 [Triparma strigata]GMH99577.1 hypothetical protein TrVE_jg1789 [Triparma verrucosa]